MKHQLVTADQAKPRKRQHTSPCSDCPWARKSLKGWIGNFSISEWLAAAHGESLIDCHTVSNQQCAGSAIFRANVCKLPRDQKLLRLPQNKVSVFANDLEFRLHHQGVNAMPKAKRTKHSTKETVRTAQPKERTVLEVKEEIAALKELKPRIRRYSGFGTDHYPQIDAQIVVLEENLDEDEIDSRYCSDDEDEDLGQDEFGEIRMIAIDALEWRDGRKAEAPSEEWKPLVIK
jgi:hypothetical protein